MGMFDEIEIGDRRGQIKFGENNLLVYHVGDWLQIRLNVPNYDIAMREGGYVHVRKHQIQGWDDTREETYPCYDKWGDPWVSERENIGEIGRELRDLGVTQTTYFFDREGST